MDPGKCSCGAVWQKEYEVCTSCGKTRPPAVNQLPLLGPRCPSACVIDLPRSAKFCFNCGAPAVYSETKEEGRVISKLNSLNLRWCCRIFFAAFTSKGKPRRKSVENHCFGVHPPAYRYFLCCVHKFSCASGCSSNMNSRAKRNFPRKNCLKRIHILLTLIHMGFFRAMGGGFFPPPSENCLRLIRIQYNLAPLQIKLLLVSSTIWVWLPHLMMSQ